GGPVEVDGKVVQERLIQPWFYASGLPISDPYWAKINISGKLVAVMVQAYERRVLTYVPTNEWHFQVEMGNVGQHYYEWRYGGQSRPPNPVPTAEPTQGPASVAVEIPRFVVDLNGDLSPA